MVAKFEMKEARTCTFWKLMLKTTNYSKKVEKFDLEQFCKSYKKICVYILLRIVLAIFGIVLL